MAKARLTLIEKEVIVIAPAWPSITGGYGLAIRASLLLYAEYFEKIHFICVTDTAFQDINQWTDQKICWIHVPINTRPMWVRFLLSLFTKIPAITVRYDIARSKVLKAVKDAMPKERGNIILEDVPIGCYISDIKREFPWVRIGLRSHDMTIKAYGPLRHSGTWIHRWAWQVEAKKIERFEREVCNKVDIFWAISKDDMNEYIERFSIKPDGIIGVCMDVGRYQDIPFGDIKTIVNIGTADLRKSKGLVDFIRYVWPKIRLQIPEARFIIAGRGTKIFTDDLMGIEGLGFIDDDRVVLGKGVIFVNPQNIGSGVQLKGVVAMLAGKVLVSTPICSEGIEGINKQHFLVAKSDEEMVSQIVGLMLNPEHARDIALKARELARQNYNEKTFIEQKMLLLKVFDQ